MALFCSVCSNPTPEGVNQCKVCNNGFVSQLSCSTCGNFIERGTATCPRCPRNSLSRQDRSNYLSVDSFGFLPPSRGDVERGIALARGSRMSDVGLFGAHSDVTVPSDVAEMFVEISSTIQAVLRLSSLLMTLTPTANTRNTVRECRQLALSLQEELEIRRGK